jgi:bacteriorhodopsin
MMFDMRKLVTFVMLGIFTAAVLVALTLPTKAAFMPFLIGIPGILLCFAQLIIDFKADDSQASENVKESSDDSRTEAQMFVWLGTFTAVLIGIGFIWGGPLLVTLFVRFGSRDSWRNALFAGAGTLAVLFGVFVILLELHLFPGLIIELLM